MADDREPYEPLWATGLARESPPPAPEPEPEAPPPEPSLRVWPAFVAAALILLLAVTARSGNVTVSDLPSAWGDVPMTCATARIVGRTKTVELFHCRALVGTLPPGTYRSPGTTWSSDVDERPAVSHVIRISPSSPRELSGRAVYVP